MTAGQIIFWIVAVYVFSVVIVYTAVNVASDSADEDISMLKAAWLGPVWAAVFIAAGAVMVGLFDGLVALYGALG